MDREESFQLHGENQVYESSQDEMELNEVLRASKQQLIKAQFQPMVQKQIHKKAHKQMQKQKQEFVLNQDNAVCKICYKYAVDASLCKNEKCGILFCGACAQNLLKKSENKCPFCRTSPFELRQSPNKNKINKSKKQCELCHQKYVLQQEQVHYKKKCEYFFNVCCEYCNERVQKNLIVKHVRLRHEDKIDEIIEKMLTNPRPVFQPNQVLAKQKLYLSKVNKAPKLGTTSKFYCRGRLEGPKCTCCNGFCGPSNGENCFECMRLDIKRLGLPKGYLVNSNGKVCWRKGDEFICGTMINYQNTNCREGQVCRPCNNMRTNIRRYADLL